MLKELIRLRGVPKNKAFSLFFKVLADIAEDDSSKLVFNAYSEDSCAASKKAKEETEGKRCNWIIEDCTSAE